ncbi:hypothetical protein Gotur_028249 [Gossypium turneri]
MAKRGENTVKKHQVMQVLPAGAWGIKSSFRSLVALLFAFLVVAAIYLRQSNEQVFQHANGRTHDAISSGGCNLFSGKWVYDNKSYPLYKERECTFMSDQLACEKFGRKDLNYQFWRWQPHQCDLPRFNAAALLERLRNKRLVFVGDSLNRNQWISMICLVDSAIPPAFKSMHNNGSINVFKAKEYNATIEFYWSPLLVESNSDDTVNHRVPDRIVRVEAIEKHARHWTDADILIFNTYLWWRRRQMKVLWGSFESPEDGIYKTVKLPRVYEMALQTWARWLEVHVNRNKTLLFFMSMSPTHEMADKWGGTSGENCYGETEPVMKEGYAGDGVSPRMMRAVESVLGELKTRGLNVQMINITQLSDYRKEGHPSIYRKHWETIPQQQLSNPKTFSDCIHWCLPGVPDLWNQILYAYILQLNPITDNFTGKVNIDFGGLPGLLWLVLASNPLGRGEVDDLDFLNSLTKCRKLQILDLSYDQHGGFIPDSIGNLSTQPVQLRLGGNRLRGSIPIGLIGNLKMLRLLDLSENQFSGSESSVANLTRLTFFPNNILEPSSKSTKRSQRNLGYLDVSKLKNLGYLDVSENQFSGEIPSGLGSCNLDLSRNKLSGQIPEYLQQFSLMTLNLSFNKFEGAVPTTGVFRNATALSIMGNKKLCGGIRN